jgi:hypothetical protein
MSPIGSGSACNLNRFTILESISQAWHVTGMDKKPKRTRHVSQHANTAVDMSTMDEHELAALRAKLKLQGQQEEVMPKEGQAVNRSHQ